MKETITKILTYAAMAPSGSNSQPWKFCAQGNQIDVIALPKKDHPILNVRNRGTLVAHGALLENLFIAASHLGYHATITLFPEHKEQNLSARVLLEPKMPAQDPLFDAIVKRATNRKPYEKIPLLHNQKAGLENIQKEGGAEVFFAEDQRTLNRLGEALAVNEIIMLENKTLHKLFFDEIVWDAEEEQKKQSGLYVKTMELQPPQEKALRLFQYWPIMRLANIFGFARHAIAKENAKIYASCACMGLIVVPNEDRAFIDAGRLMERLWLQATAMNLGFHLITGVLFLKQGIDQGNSANFSKEHLVLINNAYDTILSSFSLKGKSSLTPAVLFRVGKSTPPTARSSKKQPEIEFLG